MKNCGDGRKGGDLDSVGSFGRCRSPVFRFWVVSGKADLSLVPFAPHHAGYFSF